MFTHAIVLFLAAINADAQAVTIECPGITCRSRFSESLEEHFVDKYDWIHSLEITYPETAARIAEDGEFNSGWGDTARLVFKIDSERSSRELAKLISESGYYYGTEKWTLVERTPFSDLK